ncbi:monocarboxylate transporter 5-like [Stegodyphus dumicola]|uniref:monocarboxylate transporter 5-like n=1 Tax=Stegodyphus dumicola TaxID=202533 RepID=UPI0015A78C4F|nr:monocarboxylate transporter 5-like [Stegodyphus dumicola]
MCAKNVIQYTFSKSHIRTLNAIVLNHRIKFSRRSSIPMQNELLLYKDTICNNNIRKFLSYYTFKENVKETHIPEAVHPKPVFSCSSVEVMQNAVKEIMNFRLMRNVVILIYGFSNFFMNIGYDIAFIYTKHRIIQKNISEAKANYLISLIGIMNIFGHVILGYLSDRSYINKLWLYNICLTAFGFATALSGFCKDYYLLTLYAAIYGATAGDYISLTSVILIDLLGKDQLNNVFGLLLLFQGAGCIIGPPIVGKYADYTGSYDSGFYLSGCLFVFYLWIAFSGLMAFFIPSVQKTLSNETVKEKDLKIISLQNTVAEYKSNNEVNFKISN